MSDDAKPDLASRAGYVPGRHPIDSYGAGGFHFAGMSHRGSILVLPTGIVAWPIDDPRGIDEASLEAVFAEPKGSVELLILGTGANLLPVKSALRTRCRAAGISVDAMATRAAIATYNILLEEKRLVAAALVATP